MVRRGGRALNQADRVSKENLTLTQLFDSGLRFGCSAASELGSGVGSPALSNFGGENLKKNLIGFLGKLHHCARDVSLLLGAFFLLLFFFSEGLWFAVVSSGSS